MRKIVIAGLGRDFHDFNVSSALLGWAGGDCVRHGPGGPAEAGRAA